MICLDVICGPMVPAATTLRSWQAAAAAAQADWVSGAPTLLFVSCDTNKTQMLLPN